jgi:hypothetical protein
MGLHTIAGRELGSRINLISRVSCDAPVKLVDMHGALVDGLSRPGGNATGMSVFSGTLLAKRLQVARELVPARLH